VEGGGGKFSADGKEIEPVHYIKKRRGRGLSDAREDSSHESRWTGLSKSGGGEKQGGDVEWSFWWRTIGTSRTAVSHLKVICKHVGETKKKLREKRGLKRSGIQGKW